MDNILLLKTIVRIADTLEAINGQLDRLNKEGVVVFGGQTMEEN